MPGERLGVWASGPAVFSADPRQRVIWLTHSQAGVTAVGCIANTQREIIRKIDRILKLMECKSASLAVGKEAVLLLFTGRDKGLASAHHRQRIANRA